MGHATRAVLGSQGDAGLREALPILARLWKHDVSVDAGLPWHLIRGRAFKDQLAAVLAQAVRNGDSSMDMRTR
jgi:hypothetical protein